MAITIAYQRVLLLVYSTFDLFPENQWPSFALTCRGLNANIRDMISALTEFDRYQRCDETMDYQTAIVEENGCMIKYGKRSGE
ncbi:hypothetical protein FOZ63_020594 [Perkinsus olseni]|uniref:Uncharacterized protein n=1 Tax=Perkinsus olseni TaxID=32597 RepID=A0A7J6TGT2_PEROL|nr:hypothetical protein FOZ63_020594 [Perkinsus olseni]